MIKKEILVPVILVVVGVAFVVISVLVYFSKGNAKLINHKLKLGAIIIGITATTATTSCIKCYSPIEPPIDDQFGFKNSDFSISTLIIKLPEDSLLPGLIFRCTKTEYSFKLQDTSYAEVYRDNIIPEDGSFNSTNEKFIIKLPLNLDTGDYYIWIYTVEKSQIDSSSAIQSRKIKITK